MPERKVWRSWRWWESRCPYVWRPGDPTIFHTHYCRWVADGRPHRHVCDCGATEAADFNNPLGN